MTFSRTRPFIVHSCAFARVGLCLLLAATTTAHADCGRDPACTDVGDWGRFTRIDLRQSGPGKDDRSEWHARFDHERSDISIDVDSHWGDTAMEGTVAMVGGRVMLSRGLELEPGREIDALDAPVLGLQLPMVLMARIFPDGPGPIAGVREIDHRGEHPIRLATPSASGTIDAPWTVKGKIEKASDGSLRFKLAFSAPGSVAGTSSFSTDLEGSFAMSRGPVFAETASLEGWKVYGVGPQKTQREGATILDYGARPEQPGALRAIADIRAVIAAENHPGERDPGKDFTGFWKEVCTHGYGLQIKPFGDEGKYSIVFCGPGGCGDTLESRATFITGDPHFEVINEEEIVQLGRSGDRTIYRRCTRETNPEL